MDMKSKRKFKSRFDIKEIEYQVINNICIPTLIQNSRPTPNYKF